jgi:single-strand DNA-binding protein
MNSVNLIGRLTRDPDKRVTPKGTDVSVMRLAIERPGEGSDYVTVTAFGKLAASCNQYLAKGRQVSVQGRLSHSEWKTESGERRERHEVVAATVEFLGQRPGQQQAAAEPQPAAA